jgi:polar amino acid transport system substrate-binding protein
MNRPKLLYSLPVILAICAWGLACHSLPRDPRSTLQHVENGILRIGLVERPPWVVRTAGEPAGTEVELVRQFAQELGATPEWHWGGEQQHMEALERYQLDLMIGGITDDTPWRKYVGLTGPYFESRIVVGIPPSAPALKSIKGVQVAAKRADAIAGYIEDKGAVPVLVDDLSQTGGAVAAPDWQLEQMGLTRTEIDLHREKHVMATPPGENGFIKRLDDFLSRKRSEVKALLQQEEFGR